MPWQTIAKKLEAASKTKGLHGWQFASSFDHDRAAVAGGIPLDQWDAMTDEARGRTLAVYRLTRLIRAWESYIQQPAK